MPIVDAADAADWPLPLTPMPPATAHATEQRRADRANAREASCPPPTHILYQDRSVLAVHKPVGRYCEVRAAGEGKSVGALTSPHTHRAQSCYRLGVLLGLRLPNPKGRVRVS